jgi:hypothetical protein
MTDEQMLNVYRHDAHKLRGRSHGNNSNRIAGVTVNLDVPYGADKDASRLSRPAGKPTQTIDGHDTHYRRSLLTGKSAYDAREFSLHAKQSEIEALLAVDDAEKMHQTWLDSELAAGFNESVHYPYTSLKYHTLLVGALVDNYRNGHTFDDLYLVVDDPNRQYSYRTVYSGETFSLRLSPDPVGGAASLGSRPSRSFAGAWQRLTAHPLDTVDDKFSMQLDAHLRRIRAWSTALQFMEDYQRWRP